MCLGTAVAAGALLVLPAAAQKPLEPEQKDDEKSNNNFLPFT